MFKNRKLLVILLSVIMVLAFSIGGYASYYKYTQESGANFYVGTGDKSDALEDTNQVRQILDDLGNLLGHSKRDDSYPADGTTGGTLKVTDDLENVTNALDSAGIVTGGVVSEGSTAGTFKVTAITEAYLRTSASATAPLVSVTLAEQDDQTITAANTTYFVIFTYGTPCTITTSTTPPNGYNAIPLGKVMKDGSDNVHYIDGGFRFGDGVRKLHQRAKTLRALELESGSAIEYSGTNNFTMDTGIVYGGLNEFSLTAYNSYTTQFTYIYDDGGTGWTEANSNVIDFAHYDDGDGTLGIVGNNKYSVHYVYKHIDDEDVYVVYGTGSYTLAEAEIQAIIPPTIPNHLTDFGCLIGAIIAPQAGGSFTAVIMVTSQFFSGTEVVNHNNLGGLQGGTVSEYYHLTETEHTQAIIKKKFDATQAPTVNNDIDEGYAVGSRWVDVTNDKEYVCLDNTDGAAVWTETTEAGGGATTFTGLTDTPSAYTDKAGKTLKVNSTPDAVEFANDTNVTTKTTTATLTVAEQGTILVSASSAYTITLPTAVGNTGLTYHFKKTDANYNLITLDADGTETINYENADGVPKLTYPRLNTYCAEVTVVSDGTNWQVYDEALGQVPMCRAYLNTNQEDLTTGTFTKILLETELFDVGSNFDTANNKFVCPIPGFYEIIGFLSWANGTTVADRRYIGSVYRNGASIFNHTIQASYNGSLQNFWSLNYQCSKDDYFELYGRQDSGVNTVDVQNGLEATGYIIRLIAKD